MKKIAHIILLFLLLFSVRTLFGQSVPSAEENIPYLVTFGKDASVKMGDDDFCQIFFFVIPELHKDPVYIRVFDPDIGGQHDEKIKVFNTKVRFTVYGSGSFSSKEKENKDPLGNYKAGNMLYTKIFGNEAEYDNRWYTFGPLNPVEGDLKPELGGYVFKVIAEGREGDDGNMYRYFLSVSENSNAPVEGGNAFTYEYSFRINMDSSEVTHLYPYIDVHTVAVKQYNFDFDKDAHIKIISMTNPGSMAEVSGDGEWVESQHEMNEKDRNASLDVQVIKKGNAVNNNVVFYITNQYDKTLPFYAVPIGAIPKKKIGVRPRR